MKQEKEGRVTPITRGHEIKAEKMMGKNKELREKALALYERNTEAIKTRVD